MNQKAANEIMVQHGILHPLEGQSSTDEAARFDKGLEKQVALFGPQVAEQCMPYIGYLRTLNAMGIIDEVVQKLRNCMDS